MDDQTARAFISSPISGVIMPVTFTGLTALVAGLVVGLITKAMDTQLVAAAVVGSITYLWYMNWWAGKFTEMTKAGQQVVRHELVIVIENQQNVGYNADRFAVGVSRYKIHNAVVYIANGGAITFRGLRTIGLTDEEIAELQNKFAAAGLIEPRGVGTNNGYRLTEYGEKRIKVWATSYPHPRDDDGTFYKRLG